MLLKRHEERCEALYYGLGVVQEGDTWRAPAEDVGVREKKRLSGESNSNESQVEDPNVEAHEATGEAVHSEEQRPVEQTVEAEDATSDRGIVQEAEDQNIGKA